MRRTSRATRDLSGDSISGIVCSSKAFVGKIPMSLFLVATLDLGRLSSHWHSASQGGSRAIMTPQSESINTSRTSVSVTTIRG